MSRMYALFRLIASRWIWLLLGLILATIVFGTIGFSADPDNTLATDFYLTSLLFLLNCGEVAGNVANWKLEVARWLGLATWFTTVLAVLIRLFSERALEWFIWLAAKEHVIVAGLGTHGEELVIRLRRKGEDVIVLSPNSNPTQLETCRDHGAIVLVGNPALRLLKMAQLSRSKRLLVLFDDDHTTMQIAAEAFRMLQSTDARSEGKAKVVNCVVKVTEPGLQEVVLLHDLHKKKTDFFSINTINPHELTARSMLARARWHSRNGTIRKIAVLGLGERMRLAETLVLRAVKDQRIDGADPLEIHLYDLDAERFAKELPVRFPFIDASCRLLPHVCAADRCGIGCTDPEMGIADISFDAVFVCIEDESRAVVQATKLGKMLGATPVIVRTEDSRTGLGALLQFPDAGGLGANLVAVGFQDFIFDPALVSDPRRELVAQALHEGYLVTLRAQIAQAERDEKAAEAERLRNRPANVPWERLSADDQESNRTLRDWTTRHLSATDPNRKPEKYLIDEDYSGYLVVGSNTGFRFSDEEIEFLGEQEHIRWMKYKFDDGWSHAEKRDDKLKKHPSLLPWKDLDEPTKDLDRDIFRRLPGTLARADLAIRRETTPPTTGDS